MEALSTHVYGSAVNILVYTLIIDTKYQEVYSLEQDKLQASFYLAWVLLFEVRHFLEKDKETHHCFFHALVQPDPVFRLGINDFPAEK